MEKADHLLEKGLDLLWYKGYNGTSINDIVQAAGVPKGSFYFYFDSKEDFTVKALERYFKNKKKVSDSILGDTSMGPRERLYKYYDWRVSIQKHKMKCSMGCLGSNMGTEMAEHSEKIRTTIVNNEAVLKHQIAEVVAEAQEKEKIGSTVPAEKIVDFVEDAFKGIMVSMKESKCGEPLDNFMYFLDNLILK